MLGQPTQKGGRRALGSGGRCGQRSSVARLRSGRLGLGMGGAAPRGEGIPPHRLRANLDWREIEPVRDGPRPTDFSEVTAPMAGARGGGVPSEQV